MALVALAQAQKTLNWIQKMPTGYSLNQGDSIKLVLDDFIDVKGARFYTGDNKDVPNSDIIPKINLFSKNVQLIDGNAKICYQSYTDNTGSVYMICQGRFLVMVKTDATLGNVTAASSFELVTPQTGDAGLILKKENQICGEISEENGVFYIPCFIQPTDSAPASNIFIFRVPRPASGNFTGTVVNYTICKNEKPANVQYTPVSGYLKMVKHTSSWIFYNSYPLVTPAGNSLSYMTCSLDVQSGGFSTSYSYNLVDSLLEGTFTGFIRFFRTFATDQVLFAIAPLDSTNKTLGWGILPLNANGGLGGTPAGKMGTNLTWWNASTLTDFDPKHAFIHIPSSEQNKMMIIGDNYIHISQWSANSAGNPYITFTGGWSSYWINCGHKSTAFVSRVYQTNGLFSDPATRLLIEYRAMDGTTYKIQDFTVHFNASRYGCASASPVETTQMQIVSLLNSGTVFTTNDNIGLFFKLAPETLLNITVANSDPAKEIKITAVMNGYNSNSTTFTVGMYADATKVNSFEWSGNTFRAYNDSTFALPVSSANFIGNGVNYTTTADNVKIKHSTLLMPKLDNITVPAGAVIHRIFAIDGDTYGAVLRFAANGTEAFYVFWTTWSNDQLVVQNVTALNQLEKGLIFFKAFKLSTKAYCIVLKRSFSVGTNSSTVSCWEDKANGTMLLNNVAVSINQEIHDIQILESLARVDFLMVGVALQAVQNSLFYYSLDISPNNEIRVTPIVKLNIPDQEPSLAGYSPVDASFDLWGDQDGSSFISVKMTKSAATPIIAKLTLTFVNGNPMLGLTYVLPLENPDIAFCANKNEMILYNPRKREIFSMRWDVGMDFADKNKLFYPIKEYGIIFIQQFNCVPEKGLFQILGTNSNKEKFVITYRGGESLNLGRRVHSVSKVDPTVNFIESGLGSDHFVTVAGASGPANAYRAFLVNWYNGPLIWVNNVGKAQDYEFIVKSLPFSATGTAASKEQPVKISIAAPVYTPTAKAKEKFPLNTGDTIFLDDKADITGPVMDISITGDIANLEVTERNNKHKSYNPFSDVPATRIFAERDFMGLLYEGTKVTFLGDPSLTSRGGTQKDPQEVGTLNQNARDLAMISYGSGTEAVAIIKEYVQSNSSYCYSVYHMSKTGTGTASVYAGVLSQHLVCIRNDFDSLQITAIKESGDVIIAVRSRKAYISNFVALYAFKKVNGNKFELKANTALLSEGAKSISEYSVVDTGRTGVAIISYYDGFSGLILSVWDTMQGSKPVFRSQDIVYKFGTTAGGDRKLTLNYLKCWYSNIMIAECILVNNGINNYMFKITYSSDLTMNPISDTALTGEFELPPMFEIKRLDRGRDHVGFLLQKSTSNKASRILQAAVIDKFSDCNNIIAIYKPTRGKHIYTGITCSEWNKFDNVDFTMEFDTKEYLYFTRGPVTTPAPKRLLQGSTANNNTLGSNFISPIMIKVNGPVDATKVQMSFIGLMGTADPNPTRLTLEDFKKGADNPAPADSGSSFWTWFIIIVIILVVIGGAYAGWMWYQGQSSGSSSGTYSKTTAAAGDMEDSRL